MPTFAACEIGAIGNVANTFTTIGTAVTLAQGASYPVWGMGASIVTPIGVAAERYGGSMRLDPATPQDWSPVPTPYVVPTPVTPSQLGTTTGSQTTIPTAINRIPFAARGGTIVNLQAAEAVANNAAAVGMMFILYGVKPAWAFQPGGGPPFNATSIRTISGSVDSTAETSIGTVQLGTGDSKIVGICEMGAQDGALTADEEVVYRLRLTSEDTDISNFRFPGSASFHASEGTLDVPVAVMPFWVYCDIPVKGNSTIQVLADHQIATNTEHQVFVATA